MKYILVVMIMTWGAFANQGTLMIEVSYTENGYAIERAWKIKQIFPATVASSGDSKSDILIEFKDSSKTVVETIQIENPRIIRGVLDEDSIEKGRDNILINKGTFIVRYPYNSELKYLNIVNSKQEISVKDNIEVKNVLTAPSNVIDMEFDSLLKNNES